LLVVLIGLGGPPLSTWFWREVRRCLRQALRTSFFSEWLWIAAGDAVIGAICRDWLFAASSAASFLLAVAVRWWWRRKDRKRAIKALGEKSRARIADLVAALRESWRPRPVLRPQPGGAQAIRSLKSQ
jgi:hypothetical protein